MQAAEWISRRENDGSSVQKGRPDELYNSLNLQQLRNDLSFARFADG